MDKTRVRFTVEVNLDPVPEWGMYKFPFHSPQPTAVRQAANGQRRVVRLSQSMPLNGECRVWSMLNRQQRAALLEVKFR